MSDILARQRQLIGATADWAVDDLVIGDGEIAIERLADGSAKLKIGNGTDTFLALPYQQTEQFPTWHNNTASRSLGTVYENTHGAPMAAMVQGSFTGNNNTWQLEVSADGSTGWMTVGGFWSPETGTNEAYVNGIIPEDWFYRLNTTGGSPTLHAWNECY